MATDVHQICHVGYSEPSRTYSVPEIAAILKISRTAAYDLCKIAPFRTIKVGRAIRISKRSFDNWLDGMCE